MNATKKKSNSITELKYVDGKGFIEEESELVPVDFGNPDEECYVRNTYFRVLEGADHNSAEQDW